jgi:hypothetical protein
MTVLIVLLVLLLLGVATIIGIMIGRKPPQYNADSDWVVELTSVGWVRTNKAYDKEISPT